MILDFHFGQSTKFIYKRIDSLICNLNLPLQRCLVSQLPYPDESIFGRFRYHVNFRTTAAATASANHIIDSPYQ